MKEIKIMNKNLCKMLWSLGALLTAFAFLSGDIAWMIITGLFFGLFSVLTALTITNKKPNVAV